MSKNETENKVYVIEPNVDLYGGIQDLVKNRDELGRSIVKLAREADETVWFHGVTDDSAGGPVIFLECSPRMIEKIKETHKNTRVQDLWPNISTARDPGIKDYFSQAPASLSRTHHPRTNHRRTGPRR